MIDLERELPRLLPKAVAWAEARATEVADHGNPLTEKEKKIARNVGVEHTEDVRIVEVKSVPLPEYEELRVAALQTGLLGPGMVGLTLGYAIYIIAGHRSNRLLSHECRHVYQYESAGSIAAFLPVYLQQIAMFGYDQAPFEIDAREHERDDV